MGLPQELQFLPMAFDRSTAPEAMPPAGARTLANADADSLLGRVRRAPGYARADFAGEANTINNAFPVKRRDGTVMLIYGTTGGDVNVEVPNTAIDGGGLPCLWVDVDDFVPGAVPNPDVRKRDIKWRENFEEEAGFIGDAYSGA